MRAQANLVAVAVALVVLTATTATALVLADGAFASGTRDAEERRLAVALAERLVAADAPTTRRANVLNATALAALDGERLRAWFPASRDATVRVRLGDRTLVEGSGGTTARRVVLVSRRQAVTRRPPLTRGRTTLPRRTDRVRLGIDPPPGVTVGTVRANGRVVLHEPGGLDGRYTVATTRYETVTLAFEADGPLPPGSVAVTYFPERTTKTRLEVTVDA